MENVSVSQLLSETDLIDILFHTCDESKTGNVSVSSLIKYLEKMTDTNVQHRDAVQKLSLCLDPDGRYCTVDLETYRTGMRTWIEQLRTHLGEEGSPDLDMCSVVKTSAASKQVAVYSPPFEATGFSHFHAEPISAEETVRHSECEDVDMSSQLEDLRHNNRRLSQENNKLQVLIDQQEDTLAALTQDKNNLIDKLRRLQDTVDLQSEIVTENEELKSALNRSQEQHRAQEIRIIQLERENATLTSSAHDLEMMCNKLTSDGDALNIVIKDLQRTVCEQKAALEQADENQKNQTMELSEREQAFMDVRTSLKEMSSFNEELKRSNEELQMHLSQTQLQLARQNLQLQQGCIQMVLSSQDGSESDDENSDDDKIRSVPFNTQEMNVYKEPSSIHTEIRNVLEEGKDTPSPLSAKEQRDMKASDDQMWTAARGLDVTDFLQQLTDNTLESFVAALMKGCRAEYNTKEMTPARDGSGECNENQMLGQTGKWDSRNGSFWDNTNSKQVGEGVDERFGQFLQKVKELKDENERIQGLYDAVVDDVLNKEGEFSVVATADTRVMVLRDIVQEERSQKTKFQERVVTLKKILGVVDKKNNLDFDAVKDTLCRQQDKIEHLKRSNLDLAEKYHKAELKITDLQEEAQQAALRLEREKYRCTKLEDAVNTASVGRQLDLREIWRLVQKDVESEYLENQDGNGLSASAEEIKEKIIKEIKARENKLKQMDHMEGSARSGLPFTLPLHRPTHGKITGHCCGYRCTSSSPLVDALTIDFFNGNYYPLPKKPHTSNAPTNPYMNYLRMSCEDVDCMECRAYRLGLDLQGVASCPSLQPKLGQDHPAPLGYGGFSNVVTPLDYNFNSQTDYNHLQRDNNTGVVSSPPTDNVGAAVTMSSGDHALLQNRQAEFKASQDEGPPCSAKHRRLDFCKSSRGTSGTTESFTSYTSTSFESGNSSPDVHFRAGSEQVVHHNKDETDHSALPHVSQQCSPAGFRRQSFLAAVDKTKGKNMDWNRRPSYRAAIDPRYLSGDSGLSPSEYEQQGGSPSGVHGIQSDIKAENKTVTFQLAGDGQASKENRNAGGSQVLFSSSSLSSSTDSDNAFWGSNTVPARGTNGHSARKLSVLVEEEDAEDSRRIPEKHSPASQYSRSPTSTSQHFNFESSTNENGDNSLASHQISDPQRSGAPAVIHGSPHRSSSNGVKAYLMATEEETKGMAAQPACNAENMPAHFKQRSELTPTTASSPASAAAASTVTSAASASSVTSPQSLVLVPDSPPQTPRAPHDGLALAATPSRLAKLRQNNLARKREQMKTMKMPELSEHAESSDSELSASNSASKNSAPTDVSSESVGAPRISVSSDDNDDKSKMDTSNGEHVLRPPSPTDDPVTPSIPDSFLKQLGLAAAEKEQVNGEPQGVDQLPDKQLESRFNSLALAFKTDRLTLDKRLGIQERSRDIAEQNIDKELQGLRDAIEILNQLCSDERVQEVTSKIQHHLDILEHSVARVSSRAEVFGAVQQEKRMCLAMDVMITFTENIRRLRATELNEVSEARKLLSDRDRLKTGFSLDTLSIGDRRSASMCAGLNNPRTRTQRSRPSCPNPIQTHYRNTNQTDTNAQEDARRRSEVALPRFFGGAGSPSLHVNSTMDSGFLSELSQSSLGSGSRAPLTDSSEEPRQRFQSATANVTVRNVVTNTLRRASLERQKNLSLQSSSSSSSSRNNSVEQPQEKEQLTKQHSQEEEAYRHGYEEGLKANLSRELTDLRDQQTNINTSLEQVMDRVETLQQEDKDDSELDETVSKLKDILVKVRLWMSNPNWQSASHTLRKIAAGIIFLVAMAVVVFTFAPLIPGNVTYRNHAKPAQ